MNEITSGPVIAVTMGDPAGVGPEVVVKALHADEARAGCRAFVVGDVSRLALAAERCGIDADVRAIEGPSGTTSTPSAVEVVQVGELPADLPFGEVSAASGDAAYGYIARAVELALAGEAWAICTAPINKASLNAAGHRFPGHTELLAHLTGTDEVSMLLSSPGLDVIHVTTHIGLLDAIERIDAGLVYRTIARGHRMLAAAGLAAPRIAVCGINPHAGEDGLFGRGEEAEKIAPAVVRARDEGIDVHGPLPADTLFFRARRGDFDLVVAMYHDQGHGPVKVLGLESGVNITVGLPFVRTSVDHGTAFDIAGTGVADERSMVAAIGSAARLAAPPPAHGR
jgi:4-phospho-D-threonate 3-dehydrogenase / 4-phospho-D-erythronate 3-dehydrogenase